MVSTSNQNAIVWNLALPSGKAIDFVLKSHSRAITDINFSAHDPNTLATCSIDSFVHCWDLRAYQRPVISFCDWFAGATQVKYNRTDPHILASAHDKYLYIWDTRMGARPLRKIEAHPTKIYGLDWNRTRKTGIITCALDKSVRFWDYNETPVDDTPERIIHTSFPVWRARHTPFGWGVMTMPQRGDTSLYLWDRRANGEQLQDPIAKFEGHTDHVKEFLWRWRGDFNEAHDDREFQLISWGLDRDIRLWDVSNELLAKVGHDPEKKLRYRFTRKGAKYETYRDEAKIAAKYLTTKGASKQLPHLTLNGKPARSGGLPGPSRSGLGISSTGIGRQLSQTHALGDDRRYEKSLSGMREGGFMRARRKRRAEINPIAWMKGVKIGRKSSENGGGGGMDSSRTSARGDFASWDAPENLGDEISFVGSKFPKVNFEKVNIAARTCTVSLTGPWGADNKWIFVRVDVSFPQDYPTDTESIPVFRLEKTNIIPEAHIKSIDAQLQRISTAHVKRKRVCLEACLSYLLGERNDSAPLVGSGDEDDNTSSDEEEIVNIGMNADEEEGLGTAIRDTNQASVPLPKECGAVWTHDGSLICFFKPREERVKPSLFSQLGARDTMRTPNRLFEGFGKLFIDNRHRPGAGEDFLSETSFSSDESTDEDHGLHPGPTLGWHLRGGPSLTKRFRRGGSTDRSTQRSTGTGVKTVTTVVRNKSIVVLHDFSHLLPANVQLAREYRIGEGPEVCAFNAAVAERYGFQELANVWHLVEMVLCNTIPLEIYSTPRVHAGDWGDTIMVMAKRASLEIKRRDSGLGFDISDTSDLLDLPAPPDFFGRVKWGGHPFGGSWLIAEIFRYFEAKADIQMLAMLTCALAQSSPKTHATPTTSIAIPSRAPRDYYSDISTLPQQQQQTSYSISPSHPSLNSLHPHSHGSYSSASNLHFEAMLPYSTGTTPPTHFLDFPPHSTLSLSSSPDHRHRPSPPPGRRLRPSPADSILTFTPNVTWGAITTFGTHTSSKPSPPHSRSSSTSSRSSSPPLTITLQNQDQFFPAPLAPPPTPPYQQAYANLLYTWELPLARLELLKLTPGPAVTIAPGLEIAGCCSKCAAVLDVTSGAKGECKRCKRRQVTMTCVVCERILKGLYAACLRCGHVAHAECERVWWEEGGEGCASGCGCWCGWETGETEADEVVHDDTDTMERWERGGYVW